MQSLFSNHSPPVGVADVAGTADIAAADCTVGIAFGRGTSAASSCLHSCRSFGCNAVYATGLTQMSFAGDWGRSA